MVLFFIIQKPKKKIKSVRYKSIQQTKSILYIKNTFALLIDFIYKHEKLSKELGHSFTTKGADKISYTYNQYRYYNKTY